MNYSSAIKTNTVCSLIIYCKYRGGPLLFWGGGAHPAELYADKPLNVKNP